MDTTESTEHPSSQHSLQGHYTGVIRDPIKGLPGFL